MRYFISISSLFLCLLAQGQRTIDTVYYGQKWKIYLDSTGQKIKEVTFYDNGKPKYEHLFKDNKGLLTVSYDSNGVKLGEVTDPDGEKIDTNSKGQKIKETAFYRNGKVQSEHFFENGMGVRWVTYDSNGVKTNEWLDAGAAHARFKKLRYIILLLTGIFLAGLLALGWKLIGYKRTYFIIAFLSVLYPLLAIGFNLQPGNMNEVLLLILSSAVIELPLLLLALSIRNLIVKTSIPNVLSVVNVIVSAGLLLLFAFSMAASVGGGIIG